MTSYKESLIKEGVFQIHTTMNMLVDEHLN